MGQTDPMPSCSEEKLSCETKESEDGPLPEKRRKLCDEEEDKLEHRLGGILCCAVCLDLPQGAVYQCTNGHLMCAPCFTHLLADARLRDEASTCPNCRVEISKTSASRNLAVEKTVSELPSECKFCAKVFPRHSLQHHEEKKCEDRRYKFTQIVIESKRGRSPFDSLFRIITSVYWLVVAALRRTYLVSEVVDAPGKRRKFRRVTGCRYACIGCGWRGPQHEARGHEAACALPSRSAGDVVAFLTEREERARRDSRVYDQVLDLLSYEKITFNDLQLKPYRTEEFIHKLYYESARFSAFGHTWVVKAFVNNNQRDPALSYERDLSYQLILKSKAASPVAVQWVVVRGPWGEARVAARVAQHAFCDTGAGGAGQGAGGAAPGAGGPAAPPLPLPLADPAAANRLLANKALHLRLIMFLMPN